MSSPNPFSRGGTFTGMDKATFRRVWLPPDVWPLFAAVGMGAVLGAWVLYHEFALNPRYTIAKSKRESPEIAYTEQDVDQFHRVPLIPHASKPFSFLNFSFRPVHELEVDERAKH